MTGLPLDCLDCLDGLDCFLDCFLAGVALLQQARLGGRRSGEEG